MRRFEDLRVWQEARILVKQIYNETYQLKDFGFKDQLQRAAVSIMNNIAEGSEAGSDNLFIRYLKISKGSCAEVKSMLYLSDDLNHLEKNKSIELIKDTEIIAGGIQKLIDYLNKKNVRV